MNLHRPCPCCGVALLNDARAQGLCPACLLQLGLADAGRPAQSPAAPEAAARIADLHPDWIGPYRILDVLGEGGMGIVYLAEQADPIRRRVAVKVIKPGLDTANVLARFEAERQALAVMSHPNVAKVFDAGATEEGRPYFVMEYLPGVAITDYCDMRCLSIPERLKLFVQVCDAIQHAHQKGIIHRDIKPSNVLVASQDGHAVMKVIDFGIAKATGQRLTERTLFTQHGVLLGTSEYMSPEQAGRTGLEIDARTDIYSLGILLYELMVGARPFDPVSLRRAAMAEMERVIREEEPPKPSTKFSTLGARVAEIARQRRTDVRSLARQLTGELEWIALRAIEKNPARRYASASEFGADLMHHLLNEPVMAGPAAPSYRLKKLIRRHRVLAAAAAAVLVVLMAGIIASTLLYSRAETARGHAEVDAARNRLDAEAMQAALHEDANEYLRLSGKAIELHRAALGPHNPALAPHLVNRLVLVDYLFRDRWPEGLDGQLQETTDLIEQGLDARDMSSVSTLLLLADYDRTDEAVMGRLYSKAFNLVRDTAGKSDEATGRQLQRLADLVDKRLPESFPVGQGQQDAFQTSLREVLALRLSAGAAASADVGRSRERLSAFLVQKADRLEWDGAHARAEATYREALALAIDSGSGSPARLAEIESKIGRSLLALGRRDEGRFMLTKSLGILRMTLGDRSATTQQTLNRLATSDGAAGNAADAERYRLLLPSISVAEVRDLGTVTFAPRMRLLRGGFSGSLSGRSVWAFSDLSVAGRGEKRWEALDSSWGSTTLPVSAFVTITGATGPMGHPRELLPLTPEEAEYNRTKQDARCVADCGSRWVISPLTSVGDEVAQRMLVFYTKSLRNTPSEDHRAGTSIAMWSDADSPALRQPTLLFGADEPPWGSGALVVRDLLYVFACQPKGLTSPCLLARVPVAEALDRAAWRFYSGDNDWSTDWRLSKVVLDRHPPLNVHWNEYLGKYLIATTFLSHRIDIAMADTPSGPWAADSLTIEGLLPIAGFPWIESPVAHPEWTRHRGRIEMLTYIRSVGWLQNEMRVVEVEFRKQDASVPGRGRLPLP